MSRRITIERVLPASLAEVWALWTTPAGVESWWGPEGFAVTVQALDLRPSGMLRYTMTAVGAQQIAFMKHNGMPLATQTSITYVEVVPDRRLAYVNHVDFVPGLTAYEVGTLLELEAEGGSVRLRLTLDPMHDQEWTNRAVMGWESELGKLQKLLAARAS